MNHRISWVKQMARALFVFGMWMLAAMIPVAGMAAIETGMGVQFNQVNFTFDKSPWPNSSWGRMDINPMWLIEFTGLKEGYLNVSGEKGWYVANVPVSLESIRSSGENQGVFCTYFNLGLADPALLAQMSDTEALVYLQEVSILVKGFQAYVTFTEEPQREMPQGQMTSFPLSEIFDWDAEGVGEYYTSTVQIPPYIVSKLTIPAEILNTRHTQDSSINVEAAKNQCFPMSVANSLQYLEKVFGINVPHDHVMGLNGDKSLVGQLDELAGRSASSRRSGSGTWFTPMVKGKFQYLEKNGLADRLVHKYQGRGWGTPPNEALPAGDYTSNGSTATDQGAAVTFEWLCQEIKAGEDVELVFSYDDASGNPTGGHAVRVFECGTVLGKPYIKYLHDRKQNDDTKGLEVVQVFLEDLDGDGLLNLGTLNREIRFALSESVKDELKTPTPTNTFQIRPTSTPTSTPTPTNTLQIRPTPTPTLETPPENCPIFFSIEEPNVLPNGGTHGDILVHNPGGPAFVLSGGSLPELMEPFFTSHEEALKYDVGLDGFDILQLNFLVTAKIPHKIVFTVEKPFKVTNTSHRAFADTLSDGDLLLTNGGVILAPVLIQPLRLLDANKQSVATLGIDAIEIEGFLQSFDNLANTVIDTLEELIKYTGGVPITIYFSLEEDNQEYLADSGSLLPAGTRVSADDLIMLQISANSITAEVVRSGVDWIPTPATSILSGFSAKTNRGLDAAATCLSEGETHGKLGRIYFSTEFDDDLEPIEYEEGDLLFHQLTPPFNQLVATNAELTGDKEKKYGLDAVDLYPEQIEYKPTVTPTSRPTATPTPTFYPDPEGCVEAGDYYTSETSELNSVVLGPVEIFAPMNLSNVPPRLSVTDCSGDGNLDVSIPWTESNAVKQAAIVFSTSLCEGKAPQTVEVVITHGYQCILTAYNDAGALVDTAEAAEGSGEQTLTLTSTTGIRIVEITGSEICILKVCWKCKAEEKPTPTSTPTPTFYPDPEGCVEAGDYYTTETSGLTSAVLGPIEIFAPSNANGAPIGVNITDCSGDGALDISIPWSESSAAKPASIVFSTSLCEGKAPRMAEVVLKHGYQCKLSAYDDAGNLVDSQEAMEESGEQTLTLTSSTGIRLVEITGAEICIIQVCWNCRPSESPTPTPTPPITDPGLGPEDGIQFHQVDFLFEDAKWENSGWGRLEINPYLLEGRTNRQQGYINVFSDQGWHVVNLPIQANKANYLSTQSGWLVAYFNIGLVDLDKTADMNSEQLAAYLRERSIRLSEFKAYVTYTEKPLLEWQPGALKSFPLLQPWIWDAQGVSDFSTSIYQLPPRIERIPKFVIEPLFVSHTQPQSANVETAYNQCFPMSIANSLQYLENEFGLSVPDDHVMGLKGDNSLVGLLDTYANRSVTSRRAGSGTWFTPMINGKFKYLSDRGLAGLLIHKYQGRGWGTTPNEALPAGDYNAHGSTLKDEGATVTFDWICQQIQDGEDVELVFSYDNAAGNTTGGHAVRVFECGKILGKPYIKYLHDSNQNNDNAGLETVMVYLEDLDGDGLLNLGALNREIRFAMAESMKSKPIQIFPNWGLTLRQVHFAFEKNQEWYSNWGRMEIETKRLAEYTGQRQGFVNVYANGGWIVTNLPIDLAANRESDKLVAYFNLGMASGGMTGAAKSLNLYAEYSLQPVEKSPWERGRDLKGIDFVLAEAIVWDAQGISELDTPAISQAPPFYTHFEIDISSIFEKYTQDHSVNIETAYNQCFPMAIANSLQYLEDIFGISVPHNHTMGLKGDSTLVGLLDTYGNRSVTSRRSGSGMWFTPMIEGKFRYLADYNVDEKLVHKYQGRGWGTTPNQALPAGDYSAHGSTLKDEGGIVTYEWIREQIRNGEDVELVFSYDNAWGDATGGHAVRVFECGRILGKPYIKYLHDRNQSDDTDGLEEVLVNLEDLDGDGILNLGSTSREIRFAMAESIKDELKTPTPTPTPKVVPTSTSTNTPTLRPPTPTNTPRPSPTPTVGYTGPWVYDDLIVAQGLGGQTLINIRYYNQEIGALSSIRRAFSGISGAFLDRIGGGEGRATYLSVGDLDGDGIQDVVTTFGLVLGDSPFPNIVVVRNSQTQKVIGSSFVAFPMGEKPPQYNGGEIRTAIGNFTGAKLPQVAVAQGFGGTGVIRLYQFTNNPPPNSWEVVGQFNGLPANLVNQVDSSGNPVSIGLTVAAGDLDQDGLDELVVGQTNGPASQTIFHVLDIDNKGGIARRTTYAGFKSKFRGNGGIELQVGDLNGDRYPEIIVGSMGNLRNFNDERDTVPLNLVGIISPVVEKNQITGFTRPLGKSVFNAFTEEINPSGAVTLAIGEFDGNPTNGKELAVGTNAYQEIDGKNVISRLWPSEPRYKILRLEFDGKTVNAVNTLGPVNGYVAFVGKAVPTSKAIFMAAIPKLGLPDTLATPTPTRTIAPTPTITPTPTPYIQPKLGWIPFVEGAKEGAGPDSIMKEETTSGLLVNFNIPGMFAKEFKVDDVIYHRLIVPGLGHRDRLGEPELPIVGRLIEVPYGVSFSLEIYKSESFSLPHYNIYPAQEHNIRMATTTAELKIDKPLYQRDEFYPKNLAEFSAEDVGVIRGHRVLFLQVNPIQFNPVTDELRAYSNIEVRIVYNRPAQIDRVDERKESAAFEEMLENSLINYKNPNRFEREPVYQEPNGCDYLIIADGRFYDAKDPTNPLTELSNWKRQKGYYTRIVSTADIQNGTTAAGLQTYIQNAYDRWYPCPSYVLLAGDAEMIPPVYKTAHSSHGNTLIGTDLYYATVDGNDYFPDLYIGRLSVDTPAQLETVVDKILAYEKEPPNTAAYYTDTSLACLFEDVDPINGEEDDTFRIIEMAEEIRTFLNGQGYDCERIYNRSGTHPQGPLRYENGTAIPVELTLAGNPGAGIPGFPWDGDDGDITDAINNGNFIITFNGHGGNQSWGRPNYTNANVNALTNGNLTPVVFCIACKNGWFDNETDAAATGTGVNTESMCEAFLRLANGGCVATIGSTRNSSSPNDFLILGLYKAIWPAFDPNPPISGRTLADLEMGPLVRMGQIHTFGKIYIAESFAHGDARLRTFEMYTLFGCPEMPVWTENPRKLRVKHPQGIGSTGEQAFVVQVTEEAGGIPVNNAVVVLTQENHIIEIGTTNAGGYSEFTLTDPFNRPIVVTVTRRNFRPYEGAIEVSATGGLINRLAPDNGIEGQDVLIGGKNFQTEQVDIYFDGTLKKTAAAGAAGSFGQAGVEDVSIQVPAPYTLGPVNIMAKGRTSGRYAVDIFRVRSKNPIDLYTYSQWASGTWHLHPGQNETWNNPEIQLYDASNNPVSSNNLTTGEQYTIRATIHNDTDFPAQSARVTFKWADFGVGQPDRVWEEIDTDDVDVPAHGTAQAEVVWTPPRTGHLCVLVDIYHVEDIETGNNRGQENCHVGPTSSPANVKFTIWNPTGTPAMYYLELRQLIPVKYEGKIPLWTTKILQPDPQLIEPGDKREIEVVIDPDPADVRSGQEAEFALTGFINGKVCGGVNFIITKK